jgi:hypothetical protein
VRVERAVAGSTVGEFASNITVVSQAVSPGLTVRGAVDANLVAARKQGYEVVGEPESAGTFDGVEGVKSAWAKPSKGSDQIVVQGQVALVRGDRAYFITLSCDRTDPDLGTAMDVVQRTWKWS